jgi:peptidoglycan hydrolase CwlO-like protein
MVIPFYFSLLAQDAAKVYPSELDLEEQFEYIIDKSSIWNMHTLIYTDWVNKLRHSAMDSLSRAKNEIVAQQDIVKGKDVEINNLKHSLEQTQNELTVVQKEKNSLTVFGANISKGVFLTAVIVIVLGLAAFAVIAYGLFKRSYTATRKTQNELDAVSKEFETYRQESRKKQEQLVVQHHREIQKLKGL